MPGTVVDASVSAAWCFEDEASEFTDSILDLAADGGVRVPALWPVEMANLLVSAERRGRVDAERVDRFLEALVALPIRVDSADAGMVAPALVRVSRRYGLSAYDASYLELAVRTRSQLASRDVALLAAAENAGVSLAKR